MITEPKFLITRHCQDRLKAVFSSLDFRISKNFAFAIRKKRAAFLVLGRPFMGELPVR